MAATAVWQEDNGTAAGSPAKGTTRANATQVDWKSVDDIATARASATIIAGTNSFVKYQFVKFTGTFNQISAGKFAHTAGTLGTGLTLVDLITSTYATPVRTALAGSTNITAVTAIASGQSVNFHTTGPEGATPTATLAAAGFTQYIATQLQTTTAATAGDIGAQTLTFQWNEN
jgi:hypothetical protein